jgi:hypothetical protein
VISLRLTVVAARSGQIARVRNPAMVEDADLGEIAGVVADDH